MTDHTEDDEGGRPELPDEAEFRVLLAQYVSKFGDEPSWWVLGHSDDRAHDIREAIRTGEPIVLNIPPDCVA